jgi:hypothetical protein
MIKSWKVAFAVGAVVVMSPFASMALGAETIDEYKAEVEPICKVNANANKRILSGVREEVREGKLKAAAAQFGKAARALSKTYKELEAVAKPPAEAPRLGRWLSYVKVEVGLLEKVAKALKAGEANRAQTFVAKLTHTANLANSQIVIYDLRYCKLQPSQFT